jgi:hypothetical protein
MGTQETFTATEAATLRRFRALLSDPATFRRNKLRRGAFAIGCGSLLLLAGYLSIGFTSLNPRWSVVMAAFGAIGITWGFVVRESASRCQLLAQHLNGQSISARISELETK